MLTIKRTSECLRAELSEICKSSSLGLYREDQQTRVWNGETLGRVIASVIYYTTAGCVSLVSLGKLLRGKGWRGDGGRGGGGCRCRG